MMRIEKKFETANSWLMQNTARAPFCQSFEWEEILSREGKDVERLTIVENDEAVAMALVEYHKLPFGWRYAFCPKGPIVKKHISQLLVSNIYHLLAEYLKEKNCIFFRMEPAEDLKITNYELHKTIDVNPRATMVLDLKKTPDELLARMHQKTRYNINLSQKKDLRVIDKKDADLFTRMMRETAKRDRFRPHQSRHYHEIIFSPLAYQLTVLVGDKPIAGAIFLGLGNTFTYLFGASDYESRALMAPYLIQWEGIKIAQRFGYRYYDFFGVAPRISSQLAAQSSSNGDEYRYDLKHQYAGVTRFKQGFGGEYYEESGTFDLIISPWRYRVYGWLRALRRSV